MLTPPTTGLKPAGAYQDDKEVWRRDDKEERRAQERQNGGVDCLPRACEYEHEHEFIF